MLIEAKLNASKSSRPDESLLPRDQLAREWDNLVARARVLNARPVLIYLTSHFSLPRADIVESMSEVRAKRESEATIAWLSWCELRNVLDDHPSSLIRDDLRSLLDRMGLTYFDGVAPVTPMQIAWRFHAETFDWSIAGAPPLNWRFE